MTRFIYDQFSKDYLEELLSPYGIVSTSRRVVSEVREIDVYFTPRANVNWQQSQSLGLLGRAALGSLTPSIFEPFRNPVQEDEICDCLVKLFDVRAALRRQAKRERVRLGKEALPQLWILTPTASDTLLSGFGAKSDKDWWPGVYFAVRSLATTIIVIHQLPQTPETLWLRLLGRSGVQKQALKELEALAPDNPLRFSTLSLFYNLRQNLEAQKEDLEAGDKELIMRLAPLYQQDRERAIQEGLEQGLRQERRTMIESLLFARFVSLDRELAAIIEPIMALPPQEFTPLLLQLSREELLARFDRDG